MANSNASWISLTSAGSGTGTGKVRYSVAPNGSPSSRSGTMTIGGYTFKVTQAASEVDVTGEWSTLAETCGYLRRSSAG